MRRFWLALVLTLAGAAALVAQSSRIFSSGTLPATCTVGAIYAKTGASAGFYVCLATDTWTGPLATGSGAPTDAVYWTGAADGTLSAEHDLSALVTGLVVNTAGTPSAYAGGACGAGDFVNALNASGALTCGTPAGGGGGALSAITAAAAANTIASGNNHSQIWNWALTSDAVDAFRFGETTAATGGTGTHSQSILHVSNLVNSTAVPLQVTHLGANGTHAFVVNDAASDATNFVIEGNGMVGIQGPATASIPLTLNPSGFVALKVEGGSTDLEIRGNAVGTLTSSALFFYTAGDVEASVGNLRMDATDKNVSLHKGGNPATSITTANNYLNLGWNEKVANGYWTIGFGYMNGAFKQQAPAYLGFQEISDTGNTYGDLVFGTRSVTTNTLATERMRIVNDGGIILHDLKTTGAAGSKAVVCVDTATGKLYASSTGTDCSN